MSQTIRYLHGLGNHLQSEAENGVLIKGRNSPQNVPFGLYSEQLSGSAFTSTRHMNLRSWLYRIHPSVVHDTFQLLEQNKIQNPPFQAHTPPTQMRWDPMPYPKTHTDFLSGIHTFMGNGSIEMQAGAAIHLYAANISMEKKYFYNADGEMLIVPQEGTLRFKTEFGLLDVSPTEIIVIPRGIKFQVELLDHKARGYICENFGSPFRLPELGLIGANGLAQARDFQIPHAAYEHTENSCQLIAKFQGKLWQANINHSPLNVVAWHGNYYPYKYDLNLFNVINSVSFDHPDPSIFTVLSSPSHLPNIANVDFVIFPPRWMVTHDTFRPPYFHRNIMSEFMGLIKGSYDAKENGFSPGGSSLHNCMSAHGPDADAYFKAVSAELKPEYYDGGLAFMFESRQVWQLSEFAYDATFRQQNYLACWEGLVSHFKESTHD